MTVATGRKLAEGRSADVYDLGDGRLLRRYRDARRDTTAEAQLMRHVEAHGVPVPEVFDAGGPDLVMARVDGPTLLESLGRKPWTVLPGAALLADLHAAVHEVPAPAGLRAPFGHGEVVCHLDLHPANVLLAPTGPVIIDWESAAAGTAAHDLAQSYLTIATSVVPGGGASKLVGTLGQRLFARRLIARSGVSLDGGVVEAVARRRLDDPSVLPSERERIRRLVAAEGRRQSATTSSP